MKKTLILTAALLIMVGCSTKEPSAEATFLSKLSQYRGFSGDTPSFTDTSIQGGGRILVMTNSNDPDTKRTFHFKQALTGSRAEYSTEGEANLSILEITEPTVNVSHDPNNPQLTDKFTLYK